MTADRKLTQFMGSALSLVKPILLTASGLLVGVQANKLITGNQLMNVRPIEKEGQKGAVIEGDTLWVKAVSLPHIQPK